MLPVRKITFSPVGLSRLASTIRAHLKVDSSILIPFGLFLFAFLLRVVYLFTIDHLPLFHSPTMDAGHHDLWAKTIADGDIMGKSAFIRSPLYPYFLGFLYTVFGVNYYIPRIFGCLFGALSVFFIYHLGRRLFNTRVGIVSALMASFTWTLIYYDGELLITSLALLMSLASVYYFVVVFEKPSPRRYLFLGMVFGLGALVRTNYQPIILAVMIFLFFYYRRFKYGLLFLLGAVIIISPVTLRNKIVLDDFIPISFYTGVNFYIGNNPYSDGRTAIVPGTRADWYGGVEDVVRIAEQEIGRPLKPSQVSAFWAGKAFSYIGNNFGDFLKKTFKKFLSVFDLRETSNNKNIYFFKNQSSFLGFPLFNIFSAFLYIPLGLLGIGLAIWEKRRNSLPVFVFMTFYIIGLSLAFVYTRLRHPLTGFFIVFAGYALYRLFTDRGIARKCLPIYGILFLFLFLNSSNTTEVVKDGHFILGNAYTRVGKYGKAKEELQKAMGLGEPYRSRIHYQLGVIALRHHQSPEAIEEFSRSLGYNPRLAMQIYSQLPAVTNSDFFKLFLDMGNVFISQKNFPMAERAYRKSIEVKDNPASRVNLGNLTSLAKPEESVDHYQQAIALDPSYIPAYINLSYWFMDKRQTDEALKWLTRARDQCRGDSQKKMVDDIIKKITNMREP